MPLFVLVSNMNLTNTHVGLILPTVAGAFGVFLMRQFMLGIPDDCSTRRGSTAPASTASSSVSCSRCAVRRWRRSAC